MSTLCSGFRLVLRRKFQNHPELRQVRHKATHPPTGNPFLAGPCRHQYSSLSPHFECTPGGSLKKRFSKTFASYATGRRLSQTKALCGDGYEYRQERRFSSKAQLREKGDERSKLSSASAKLLSKLPIPASVTEHENIYTIPNMLTISRLLVAPAIGYSIIHSHHTLALSLFAYAALTDAVDGWIARKFRQQSVAGTVIDPMADKALMTIGVITLGLQGGIPLWLATIIVGRDVGLGVSAFYFRWISLPPPKTMARYWDFSLPSAEVKPTTVSKANTALQLLLVGGAMAMPVVPESVLVSWHLYEAMTSLQYLVAATTVWSGLSYVLSNDAVKILSPAEAEAREQRKQEYK